MALVPTACSDRPERRFKATAERFEFRVLPGPFEHFSFPLVPFPVEFRPRQLSWWLRVVSPRVGMVAPMVSMVAPRSFRFLSFRFQLSFALVSIGAAPSGSEWLRNCIVENVAKKVTKP